MTGRRIWLVLGAALVLWSALLVFAAAGRAGPLVVCGADGARVCILWPLPLSIVTWSSVVLTVAVLIVCQASLAEKSAVAADGQDASTAR